MRTIYCIGTLHGGLTPNKDLEEFIEKINPDQILVEITQSDIKRKKIKSYPSEMKFAYRWARKRNKIVCGFDSSINVFKNIKRSKKDNQRVIKEQEKLMQELTWKDLNKRRYDNLLDPPAEKFLDQKKMIKRDRHMLKNIKKVMAQEGTIVIITGCGHLSFFEKNLKNAVFPLRNQYSIPFLAKIPLS